jgi:hypothetical protein
MQRMAMVAGILLSIGGYLLATSQDAIAQCRGPQCQFVWKGPGGKRQYGDWMDRDIAKKNYPYMKRREPGIKLRCRRERPCPPTS